MKIMLGNFKRGEIWDGSKWGVNKPNKRMCVVGLGGWVRGE